MTLGLDARLGDVRRFLEKVWWHVLPEVPGGKLAKLRYAKSDVFYRVDNRAEGLRQAEAGLREPSAVRWLEDHVGHDEVLYHIGAGVGTFALLAAKLRNGSGQGRVLAFESDPVLLERLLDNIAINRCAGKVVPVPLHLSSGRGPVREGLAFRLDDLLATFDLPRPQHVLLEAGRELEVLEGADRTFRETSLKSVLLGGGRDAAAGTPGFLEERGFRPGPLPRLWVRQA
jgi:hypothetical protein